MSVQRLKKIHHFLQNRSYNNLRVIRCFAFQNCRGKMLSIPIQVGGFAQPALRVLAGLV